MALGGGTITLRQIITEWSEGIGGTQNLSSFRRNTSNENAFCPTNYDTITTLPASGNLSASSFRNTNAEASAQTILNGWYPSQTNNYFRMAQAGSGSSAPPDFFNVVNNPISRYNGSWTTNYSFSGNSTNSRAYSKKSTVLQWVIGAQSAITGGSAQDGNYNLHQSYNWREQNFRVGWNDNLHRTTTSGYVSYSRLGNNSGAWDGMYVLPGLWTVNTWIQQPVLTTTYAGSFDFSVVIPAGQILFFTAYSSGYDGNMAGVHTVNLPLGVGATRSCGFWYNCAAHQVYYNGTGSSQTITWQNAWASELKTGAATTNGMFAGNNGANGHQYFLLNRTT